MIGVQVFKMRITWVQIGILAFLYQLNFCCLLGIIIISDVNEAFHFPLGYTSKALQPKFFAKEVFRQFSYCSIVTSQALILLLDRNSECKETGGDME